MKHRILKHRIPCGSCQGHGEYCTEGRLCSTCETVIELAESRNMLKEALKIAVEHIDNSHAISKIADFVRKAYPPPSRKSVIKSISPEDLKEILMANDKEPKGEQQ